MRAEPSKHQCVLVPWAVPKGREHGFTPVAASLVACLVDKAGQVMLSLFRCLGRSSFAPFVQIQRAISCYTQATVHLHTSWINRRARLVVECVQRLEAPGSVAASVSSAIAAAPDSDMRDT